MVVISPYTISLDCLFLKTMIGCHSDLSDPLTPLFNQSILGSPGFESFTEHTTEGPSSMGKKQL